MLFQEIGSDARAFQEYNARASPETIAHVRPLALIGVCVCVALSRALFSTACLPIERTCVSGTCVRQK